MFVGFSIDVDTLLFVSLSSKNIKASSWAIGWQHGKTGKAFIDMGEKGENTVPVAPSNDVQGDLWEVDLGTIQDVRNLEKTLHNKPTYDLQGYFSLLLERSEHKMHLLQSLLPMYSFGFQCSDYKHPTNNNFLPRIINNKLDCPDRQKIGFSSTVGSISFTAVTFKSLMLGKEMLPKQRTEVRQWFKRYFSTC